MEFFADKTPNQLMKAEPSLTKILTELINVNTDRIRCYEQAMEKLKEEDADLRILFARMINNSHQYKLALVQETPGLVEDLSNSTDDDRIFRMWTNVKDIFTDSERKTVLTSCAIGEDTALKAYEQVLKAENIPSPLRVLISGQKHSLAISHNTIKLLRDSQVHIMMLEYI
jgi:uncharacterized protein (TIGR02284 family)